MNNGICPDIRELAALRHHARNIQLFNDRKVNSAITGSHLSLARGRGMDFEEVRRYQNGDDIRLIHWPLTARLGKPYTKIYREERERMVYLLIDQSATMHFGTKVCFKNVMAAKVAALLGFAALNHHEHIGGIVFNDHHAQLIKPKRSYQTLLNLFAMCTNNQLLRHYPGGLATNLQLLSQNLQSGSTVIIISDFFGVTREIEPCLQLINKKAEIINILVYDPLESRLPESGSYSFTADGNVRLEINANKNNKQLYSDNFSNRMQLIATISLHNKMQFITLATNDNLVEKINHGILKYGY